MGISGGTRVPTHYQVEMFTNFRVSVGEEQAVNFINILKTYIQCVANFLQMQFLKTFSKM